MLRVLSVSDRRTFSGEAMLPIVAPPLCSGAISAVVAFVIVGTRVRQGPDNNNIVQLQVAGLIVGTRLRTSCANVMISLLARI